MAVSDHLKPGLTQKSRVKIMTVNPATRRIEGVLKDGAMIQITVWDVPEAFVWPKENEEWLVRRDNGQWVLENRQQQTQDESSYSITEMFPGEMILDSTYIIDRKGDKLLTSADVPAAKIYIISSQHFGNYTFQLIDGFTVVESMDNTPIVYTIPTYGAVRWPLDTMIEVFQYGTGQITIVGQSGVTIRTPGGVHTAGQYATIGLRMRAVDEWILSGGLV